MSGRRLELSLLSSGENSACDTHASSQCEGPGAETGTESSEPDREVFQEEVVVVGMLPMATFEARGQRLWTLGISNW